MSNKLHVKYNLTKVLIKRERFFFDLDQTLDSQVLSWNKYVNDTTIAKDAELKLILLNSLDIFESGDTKKLTAWSKLMASLPYKGQTNDSWGFYGRLYFNEYGSIPQENNLYGKPNEGFNIDNFLGRFTNKTKLFNPIFQQDVPMALSVVSIENIHNYLYNITPAVNGYRDFIKPILTEEHLAQCIYSERGLLKLVDLLDGNVNPYNTEHRVGYYERLCKHWIDTKPSYAARMQVRIICEMCAKNAAYVPNFMMRPEGLKLLQNVSNIQAMISDDFLENEFKTLKGIYDFSIPEHCYNALNMVAATIDIAIEAATLPDFISLEV